MSKSSLYNRSSVWEYPDGSFTLQNSSRHVPFEKLPADWKEFIALLKPLPVGSVVPGVGECNWSLEGPGIIWYYRGDFDVGLEPMPGRGLSHGEDNR
jgi:hypothetical protein